MEYVINNNCVCCHYCMTECPVDAINYEGTRYRINPAACIGCGRCETVCPISAIAADVPPAEIFTSPTRRQLDCDVVVVGGGTGMIAAVRAASNGKRVIVLEKAKKIGGNTNLAHGFFPVYTILHREQGMPDVREEAIEHYHRRTGGIVDKDILRSVVYGCGEFFDWLCTFEGTREAFELVNLGEVKSEGPVYGPGLLDFPKRLLKNLKCRDQAIGPGWAGTFILHLMEQECRRLGVNILTEHAAIRLQQNQDGQICGVEAQSPAGHVNIKTDACILATGGFGRSDDKLRQYFPDFFAGQTPIHRFSVPTDTGDGIDLAAPLGAVIPADRMNCSIFGPAHHPFSYVIYRMMLDPRCVYINLHGKRWIDEAKGLMQGREDLIGQPREITYGIYSEQMIDQIADEIINNPAFQNEAWIFQDYRTDILTEVELGFPAKRGDTLAELATAIGIDPDIFTAEIHQYNQFCENGTDPAFGKQAEYLQPIGEQGPYYAFYGQQFSEGAFGGLQVNSRTEVLKENNLPIPGLYAVGDATSAIQTRGTLAVISELTWAVASAYIAGNYASR